jgi:hypothetical protein
MIFGSFEYDCNQLDEGRSNISLYQGASMMYETRPCSCTLLHKEGALKPCL